MPTLVVLDRQIELPDDVAAPLIAADILYWDTMGESEPETDHLHINPEQRGFGRLEAAVYRDGASALPAAPR